MSSKLDSVSEQIVDSYVNGGVSIRILATAHGVAPGTITSILKKANVVLRKPGRPRTKG